MAETKKVSGQFTGGYAIHPLSGEEIPVYIADYVLAGYGTGAIMAVPAHDNRDHTFAKHFNLPIRQVVEAPQDWDIQAESFDGKEGKIINSDFLNGLEVKDAIARAIAEVEKRDLGYGKTNYRLRDAIFGRQRYWGEPIPVYYENGIAKTFDEHHLPLNLPEVDKFLPTEDGEPPLARAEKWCYNPENGVVSGKGFPIETTTMPGWAGSSWYYLRYMDPKNTEAPFSKEVVEYWREVDLYLGGNEHATGHLLYARFWHKFLHDLDMVPTNEPFRKMINQGMILGNSAIGNYVNYEDGNSGNITKIFFHPDIAKNHYLFLYDRIPVEFVEVKDGRFFISNEDFLKLSQTDNRFHNAKIGTKADFTAIFKDADESWNQLVEMMDYILVPKSKKCPSPNTTSSTPTTLWTNTARIPCGCTRCFWGRWNRVSRGTPRALRGCTTSCASFGSSFSTTMVISILLMKTPPPKCGKACTRPSKKCGKISRRFLSTRVYRLL
jgi:leucyl-tRNA synthetase